MAQTKVSFGRDVFGPIFAEFALRLWIYVSNLARPEETALLFCARGGLRLQMLYERFLAASGLESPVHAGALMVSRIVAVRPALLAGADSAFEQIGYEFSRNRLIDAVKAISGVNEICLEAPTEWNAPYSRRGLEHLLGSDEGARALWQIQMQAELFRAHCEARAGGRKRIVLCDTGLFGSTLQLLKDGMPGISWSAAMIARSNYKHLPAPHFPHLIGLSVEADHYCPWRPNTALLRYWQLIESILEPNLPSVTRFAEVDGAPRSNLEIDAWQTLVPPEPDGLFAGVLDYIDHLPHAPAGKIVADARVAWRSLHRAIIWPRAEDGRILDAGRRSDDFGREKSSFTARPWRGPVAALRGKSMWREGEIALSASVLRRPLLLSIETAYGLRWLRRNIPDLMKTLSGRPAQTLRHETISHGSDSILPLKP